MCECARSAKPVTYTNSSEQIQMEHAHGKPREAQKTGTEQETLCYCSGKDAEVVAVKGVHVAISHKLVHNTKSCGDKTEGVDSLIGILFMSTQMHYNS